MIEEHNILIASVGGKGGITLSRIISRAALIQGLRARVGETLGMAQRGGSVQSHVRLGESVRGPLIPERESDVLISMEPAEALRVARYIGKRTTIIMNTAPHLPISVVLEEAEYPDIEEIRNILKKLGKRVVSFDAMGLAEEAGSPRSLNIVLLGAYMSLEEPVLTLEAVKEAMATSMPSRFLKQNTKALEMGMEKMNELITGL